MEVIADLDKSSFSGKAMTVARIGWVEDLIADWFLI